MLPECSCFGLVILTQTGNHLWTIPVEIIYYLIIPAVCLAFKSASRSPVSKAAFLSGLAILCYLGCHYNLTQLTLNEYKLYKYKSVLLHFKMSLFVFLSGSLIAFILHSTHSNKFCSTLLKRDLIQLAISVLSAIQFTQAYSISMRPKGDLYMSFLHIPGFQWALFLLLLLLSNSAKWNPFVAFLENSVNLQNFGKYSFGIYLNHYAVILPIAYSDLGKRYIQGLAFPEKISIVWFCVYLIGWAWYAVLEKRLIVLGNKVCERLDFDETQSHKPLLE